MTPEQTGLSFTNTLCEWEGAANWNQGAFLDEDGPLATVSAPCLSLDLVTAALFSDLDGDGRLDLVAANWGLNSSYRATAADPVKVYCTYTARCHPCGLRFISKFDSGPGMGRNRPRVGSQTTPPDRHFANKFVDFTPV